jgi:hypothetical protein
VPVGLVVVAVAGVLGACGDDGARPRYASGLAGTSSIDALASAQRETLCDSYEAYVTTYVDLDAIAYLVCAPGAVSSSDTTEECERRLERCMALFPAPIEVQTRTPSAERCAASLEQCDATVAELEQCVNVNLDFVFDILDGLSCSTLDRPGTREMARRSQNLVSVCADLGESCSSLTQLGPY